MKVSGFTFVRNGVKLGYPVAEAIQSILPLCDEVVVAVGQSEDNTLDHIKSIESDKIKIIQTIWDDTPTRHGSALAKETDKALAAIAPDADWAIYIQADEILHEQYLDTVRSAMLNYKDDKRVDGLLFKYLHFYGSYQYIAESLRWYRHEIRVVRPRIGVYSYRDAQGFRKGNNQKLRVKPVEAYIHHYGWVRPPQVQQLKQVHFQRLYGNKVVEAQQYDYNNIDALRLYEGTHPEVFKQWVSQMNWEFEFDVSKKKFGLKEGFKWWVYKITGWHIGEYRNYKVLKS